MSNFEILPSDNKNICVFKIKLTDINDDLCEKLNTALNASVATDFHIKFEFAGNFFKPVDFSKLQQNAKLNKIFKVILDGRLSSGNSRNIRTFLDSFLPYLKNLKTISLDFESSIENSKQAAELSSCFNKIIVDRKIETLYINSNQCFVNFKELPQDISLISLSISDECSLDKEKTSHLCHFLHSSKLRYLRFKGEFDQDSYWSFYNFIVTTLYLQTLIVKVEKQPFMASHFLEALKANKSIITCYYHPGPSSSEMVSPLNFEKENLTNSTLGKLSILVWNGAKEESNNLEQFAALNTLELIFEPVPSAKGTLPYVRFNQKNSALKLICYFDNIPIEILEKEEGKANLKSWIRYIINTILFEFASVDFLDCQFYINSDDLFQEMSFDDPKILEIFERIVKSKLTAITLPFNINATSNPTEQQKSQRDKLLKNISSNPYICEINTINQLLYSSSMSEYLQTFKRNISYKNDYFELLKTIANIKKSVTVNGKKIAEDIGKMKQCINNVTAFTKTSHFLSKQAHEDQIYEKFYKALYEFWVDKDNTDFIPLIQLYKACASNPYLCYSLAHNILTHTFDWINLEKKHQFILLLMAKIQSNEAIYKEAIKLAARAAGEYLFAGEGLGPITDLLSKWFSTDKHYILFAAINPEKYKNLINSNTSAENVTAMTRDEVKKLVLPLETLIAELNSFLNQILETNHATNNSEKAIIQLENAILQFESLESSYSKADIAEHVIPLVKRLLLTLIDSDEENPQAILKQLIEKIMVEDSQSIISETIPQSDEIINTIQVNINNSNNNASSIINLTNPNTGLSSSKNIPNNSHKDEGELEAIQLSIMQNRLEDLENAEKKRSLNGEETKERDSLRQKLQTAASKTENWTTLNPNSNGNASVIISMNRTLLNMGSSENKRRLSIDQEENNKKQRTDISSLINQDKDGKKEEGSSSYKYKS